MINGIMIQLEVQKCSRAKTNGVMFMVISISVANMNKLYIYIWKFWT